MKETARRRSGECLSEFYVNSKIKLQWRCSKGHEWMATSQTIKKGCWCGRCRRKEIPFERLLDVAHGRGGKIVSPREEYVNWLSLVEWECALGGECLSKKYVNSVTPLRWRCAKRHIWMAPPNRVKVYGHAKKGHWCPQCYRDRQGKNRLGRRLRTGNKVRLSWQAV